MPLRVLMDKTVNNIFDRIEAVSDDIEVLRISGVVATENRIRNVVRNLDKTRCA